MNSSEYHQFIREQRNLLNYSDSQQEEAPTVQRKLQMLVKEAETKQSVHDQSCTHLQSYIQALTENEALKKTITQVKSQIQFQRQMYEEQLNDMRAIIQTQTTKIIELEANLEDFEDVICMKNAQLTARSSISSQFEGVRRRSEDELQNEVERLKWEVAKGTKLCAAMFQELQKQII